jgi:hypothetical protein
MAARNKVIAGDYENFKVGGYNRNGAFVITPFSQGWDSIYMNKRTVEMYEVLSEEKIKSGTSAVLRGGMGALLLGPVGLLAGLSAKNKGIHVIAIFWKDGKQSLIEVDDDLYKVFLQGMFQK